MSIYRIGRQRAVFCGRVLAPFFRAQKGDKEMTIREELKPMDDSALYLLLSDVSLILSMRKGSSTSRIFWKAIQRKINDEIDRRLIAEENSENES